MLTYFFLSNKIILYLFNYTVVQAPENPVHYLQKAQNFKLIIFLSVEVWFCCIVSVFGSIVIQQNQSPLPAGCLPDSISE